MQYGWLSLLPPLAAIALAIATHRVVLSLLAGVLVGCFIVNLPIGQDSSAWESPLQVVASASGAAVADTCEKHLWPSLKDPDHLRVFVFTMLMGAMVAVIHRGGGMQGVVNWLAPLAQGRRGGQLITWLMGLVVFIDDYANSLLLGNTMRPVTDRLRISREKLAYLVDSTAAPVSGLALISTWIAGEIGYIEDGFQGLQENVDGFSLFVQTIPYRFYVVWALLFVPVVAILGRDWGPMLRAEKRMMSEGPSTDVAAPSATESEEFSQARAFNAIAPILMTIGVTVALLYVSGKQGLAESEAAGTEPSSSWRQLMNTIGAGDSYFALFYGSLSGWASAALLVASQGILSLPKLHAVSLKGAASVGGALAILWAAWALSGLTKTDLKTGEYLGSWLANAWSPAWMPTLVFVLSSIVAFSTGTSWGTMALLMPLVIQSMANMTALEPESTLMLATIGSVLAGAIFGDHCSPISDTTVLSSQASGCHHIAHVRTQMPYALVVALVSIVCGTIPVGFGISVWVMLPVGMTVLVVLLWCFGRRVEAVGG